MTESIPVELTDCTWRALPHAVAADHARQHRQRAGPCVVPLDARVWAAMFRRT
ncbi:MAG: hypothetical protein JWR80_8484 [Bradyrhizobium sp.]|nr:hypothetical protein [Bradyrhizobium sp.]